MCGFKHCKKTGRCFLEGVSPCPDKLADSHPSKAVSGFQYDGFLEPDELLNVLGFEVKLPTDEAASKKPHKVA